MIVYGALIRGIGSVLYEGKPIHKGNPRIMFDIMKEHKINHLFTSTTAVKEFIKHDDQGTFLKDFDLPDL
jgi:propionyl-CoA synthetase